MTAPAPLGTSGLPPTFGTHAARAGWELPYRRTRPGDHWAQDNASKHYHRYRDRRRDGFRWRLPAGHPDASERLLDSRREYEYAVVTDFNAAQVRHRGAGIFLHVNGVGATAGRVSVPRALLRTPTGRLATGPTARIAIGR